jgi:hypothetical protein
VSASESVLLKLEPEQLSDIDRVRGEIPRTIWIKDLCAAAVLARDAFEGPCWISLRARERSGDMPEGVHFFAPLPE